jgi:hypothetical protein
MLAMVSFASATISINTVDIASGTMTYVVDSSLGDTGLNATFSIYCTSTNQTGYENVGQNLTSTNTSTYSFAVDTSVIMDSSSCTLRTLINESTSKSDTESLTKIDNTIPDCIDNSGFSSSDTVSPTATWSVSAGNITKNTVYLHMGGNVYKVTESAGFTGRTVTGTYSSAVPESIYNDVYFKISDGTNVTECTHLSNIRIKDDDNAKKGKIIAAFANQGQVEQNGNVFSILPANFAGDNLVVLGLLGFAGYMFLRKKK